MKKLIPRQYINHPSVNNLKVGRAREGGAAVKDWRRGGGFDGAIAAAEPDDRLCEGDIGTHTGKGAESLEKEQSGKIS